MPSSEITVEIAEHPATRAWREFAGGRARPGRIETLKDGSKSAVYRLTGIEGHDAVIAKRCETEGARIERTVYRDVLPGLPLPSLRFYGWIEDGSEFCWLFLEDSGGEPHLLETAKDRGLAARWLARLHLSAATLAQAPGLPGRDAAFYQEQLERARRAMRQSQANRLLAQADRVVLGSVLRACDELEARWQQVADRCARIPRTLVHGDFHSKNLHVRRGAAGLQFFPLDWEYAGWGPPAVDLPEVDLEEYHQAWAEGRCGLDLAAVRRIAGAGVIFQWVAAVNWAATHLPCPYIERGMRRLRSYEAEIPRILARAGRA
jgi:hypothetical protein